MNKDDIIEEIKKLSLYFKEIPYGQEIMGGRKKLQPNYKFYKGKVEELINLLSQLYSIDAKIISISEIEQIRSIRDNEIMKMIKDEYIRRKEFEIRGCDYELENVSNSINTIIDKL